MERVGERTNSLRHATSKLSHAYCYLAPLPDGRGSTADSEPRASASGRYEQIAKSSFEPREDTHLLQPVDDTAHDRGFLPLGSGESSHRPKIDGSLTPLSICPSSLLTARSRCESCPP